MKVQAFLKGRLYSLQALWFLELLLFPVPDRNRGLVRAICLMKMIPSAET